MFFTLILIASIENVKSTEKSLLFLNTYETQTVQFSVCLLFHEIVCKLKAIKLLS